MAKFDSFRFFVARFFSSLPEKAKKNLLLKSKKTFLALMKVFLIGLRAVTLLAMTFPRLRLFVNPLML